MAKKLKKSRSSVNEYEAGAHAPRLPILTKWAKITGVPLGDLLA
jgi:transcriptional regulator with XRE-family HTH domain